MNSAVPQEPTIVFAAVNSTNRARVVSKAKVDAAMCTFQEMRRRGKGHDSILEELHEHGLRTYLDSGVFQFVRRSGTTRIKVAGGNLKPVTMEEFTAYAKDYLSYLKVYGDNWDHIVELDVDEIFPDGEEIAAYWRKRLYKVVGEKLMPAWHVTRGYSGWSDLLPRYPYVSIGSDKQGRAVGDMKAASAGNAGLPPRELRHLIDLAHAADVGVHILGDTRHDIFLKAGADSGDSTAWLVGGRYGRYRMGRGSIFYANNAKMSGADYARVRQFVVMMQERFGIDMDKVKTGNQQFYVAALLLLDIQKEIRDAKLRP